MAERVKPKFRSMLAKILERFSRIFVIKIFLREIGNDPTTLGGFRFHL